MTFRVKYYAEERGFCKTIFKVVDQDRYFNRIESGSWHTVYPSQGYWENDTLVRNDVIFEVVDGAGNVLFTESNGNLGAFTTISKKAREVSAGFVTNLSLKPYEEWRDWLLADKSVYGYTGYDDNWLHCIPKEKSAETLEEYSHLGLTFRVIIDKMEHPICGKRWRTIYILNVKNNNCEALCGFLFD